MTDKTGPEINISPELEARDKELFKDYQPTSGISHLDRPIGLSQEQRTLIEKRLNESK